MLREWKTFCDTAYPEWVKSRPDLEKVKAYVIVKQEDGSLPYPDTFSHWLKKYRVRHGFERVTPHGLRHFYTTYLLVKGVDVKTVSRLMGHSKTTTTVNIYAAITKEGFDKAESVLNAESPVTMPDSE
jgi:site-specific recombinase XerD